jgi:hypothetical protein
MKQAAQVLQVGLTLEGASAYGTEVQNYVAWCQSLGLKPVAYLPAPEHLLVSYVCSLAGRRSETTARGYIADVKAWHIIFGGGQWKAGPRLEMALKAVGNLATEVKPHAGKPSITKASPGLGAALNAIGTKLDHGSQATQGSGHEGDGRHGGYGTRLFEALGRVRNRGHHHWVLVPVASERNVIA